MGNVGEILNVEEESLALNSTSASSKALPLPLLSLNHVSFVCRSVQESVKFYENVLGFVLIKRPSSFKFEGAW
jgi:catechol-2,3-dioxygenase